jgi:biopolymer transport protein ExbB
MEDDAVPPGEPGQPPATEAAPGTTPAAAPTPAGGTPAPETPFVNLTKPDGSPVQIDGQAVQVKALTDARGFPIFGPDGKLVPTPIAYEEGQPVKGEDGKVVVLTPDQYPQAPLKDATGAPLKAPDGTDLTAVALIGQDGRPISNADGSLVPLRVQIDANNVPVLTPDGKTILTAPDIPDKLPLMGPDGNPLIGPAGQQLMVPIQKDDQGRPVLGQDGKPMRVAHKTDEQGRPQLGVDGQPIPASSEEEQREAITAISMFLGASIVVQAVMVMLIMASVVTWTILFGKLSYFSSLNRRTDKFLQDFRNAKRLQDAVKNVPARDARNPLVQMLKAAVHEYDLSTSRGGGVGSGDKREHLTQRISAVMSIAQSSASQDLGSGMGIFATTGSIAPFVGLFGTVWGIMNSFIGIANTNTTNLAVVAPGIAEALFATAIGLFAAIPAVIFYNIFARKIASYNTRLDNFAGELLTRVSRQLDQEG